MNNKKPKKYKGKLHGLVVLHSLQYMKSGATRTLRYAKEILLSLGLQLHFTASRSIFHFFLSVFRENRFKFDFVLFNGLASIGPQSNFSYPLWALARFFKIPVFLYWHETDWVIDQLREDIKSFNQISKIISHPGLNHLTASKACSNSIKKIFGVSKTFEMYECSRTPFPDGGVFLPKYPPVVINLASIQARKGTDLFIETAFLVCKAHPTVKFIWLGEGISIGGWKQKIKDVGFENRILFPGYDNDPHRLLSQASVFFLTSRDDPFPLSLLEAMALGRTIVAFDVGGIPEALGHFGCLIQPFNINAAARSILEYIQKPPEELINNNLQERYLRYYTPMKFSHRFNQYIRRQIIA